MTTILFSAGDVSGEAHAAALVRALRARLPEARFVGMGGEKMRAAGVEIVVDQRELGVGGIVELIPEARRIARAYRRMTRALRDEQPALAVLVDSGGFNLPLAGRIRRTSRTKVLYFIPPQLYAWRPGRLRRLVSRSDCITVCLLLERDYYAEQGVAVEHHGHPLVDALAEERAAAPANESASERKLRVRRERGLSAEGRIVGLLPGSRRTEIAYHLPLQIEAFLRLRRLSREPEGLVAAIGLAPGIEASDVRRVGGALLEQAGAAIRLVETRDGSLVDALDVALVKPGTVTLEATLRGCPMVVVGRVHRVSAWLARRSVRVAWVALPNLVAGRAIVPELLQEAARPETVAVALAELLEGHAREAQLAGLAEVVQALGPPGAIAAVAARVEEMLGTPRA